MSKVYLVWYKPSGQKRYFESVMRDSKTEAQDKMNEFIKSGLNCKIEVCDEKEFE